MNKDIHILTASKLFNVSVDKVTDEMRKEAKVVNFGWLYGMNPSLIKKKSESLKGGHSL
jgi:DNA polymerase I-like protein with 3'-5' exonuclease and polymerase domains